MTEYVGWFFLAFLLSLLFSRGIGMIARRFEIVDKPSLWRKIHQKPTPLLGGLAIFFAFVAVVVAVLLTGDALTGGEITPTHYIGVFIGGLILMIGGVLDDKFELPPRLSIIAPILATLTVIGFGIEVDKLTNPFGGAIELTAWQSDILVFVWVMVVMYTTKFLDGLDGLSTGVSAIGALMIMFLSLTTAYFQPDVALLAAISIGAFIGFLGWNMHPARIFLGEGGSTFVGFLLGVLAVISGGKLATALLVLGIPLLDLIWVVLRRFQEGGLSRVFRADRRHLHHRLLDLGWGQRRIVLLYFFIATVFGASALFLQSKEKLVALSLLVIVMVIFATRLVQKEKTTI